LGKATVHCAFKELQEKGFVICTRRGQWYGRQASLWAVTDRGVGGGLPTNAWRRWQPGASVLRPTIKTENGSNTDPSAPPCGRIQNRRHFNGSDTAPVKGHWRCRYGFYYRPLIFTMDSLMLISRKVAVAREPRGAGNEPKRERPRGDGCQP
jgi:hypothetical protein